MSGIPTGGNGMGNGIFPFGFFDNDDDMKVYEDRYEVFVNGQFAGHKTLFNQSDNVSDVDDFLRKEGFTSFKASLDGDHYQIQASDEERAGIQEALEVYFKNR